MHTLHICNSVRHASHVFRTSLLIGQSHLGTSSTCTWAIRQSNVIEGFYSSIMRRTCMRKSVYIGICTSLYDTNVSTMVSIHVLAIATPHCWCIWLGVPHLQSLVRSVMIPVEIFHPFGWNPTCVTLREPYADTVAGPQLSHPRVLVRTNPRSGSLKTVENPIFV